MSYAVDKGIPIPGARARPKFNYSALPLRTFNVGESFLIPRDDFGGRSAAGISAVLRAKAKGLGIRIRIEVRHAEKHHERPGVRVWRLAP